MGLKVQQPDAVVLNSSNVGFTTFFLDLDFAAFDFATNLSRIVLFFFTLFVDDAHAAETGAPMLLIFGFTISRDVCVVWGCGGGWGVVGVGCGCGGWGVGVGGGGVWWWGEGSSISTSMIKPEADNLLVFCIRYYKYEHHSYLFFFFGKSAPAGARPALLVRVRPCWCASGLLLLRLLLRCPSRADHPDPVRVRVCGCVCALYVCVVRVYADPFPDNHGY